MFKRKEKPANRDTDVSLTHATEYAPMSPYEAAKREWNERYGDYIARAKNWRLVAIISSITTLVAVCGVVYIGAQNKLVPYIVEIDKLGQVSNVTYAEQVKPENPRLIKASLKRFIADFRSVSADPVIQKAAIDRLYKMIPQGSASLEKINGHYKENSPLLVGQSATVEVELIGHPLPQSAQSWQVEWFETKRNLSGAVIAPRARYKAVLMVEQHTPADEQALDLDNAIGLFVTDLNWSQQL